MVVAKEKREKATERRCGARCVEGGVSALYTTSERELGARS